MQFHNRNSHIFAESIIHGGRTADVIEDLDGRGFLMKDCMYYIRGDAAGRHRDTRGSKSDYDIIMKELDRRNIKYQYQVPPANPAVRDRHNRVNAMLCNALGERRMFVYKNCPVVDEGFRLTKLKPGANYVEDDSKHYQHCLTAVGYAVNFEYLLSTYKGPRTQEL